ncbi:hypothetical protein GCM10008090_33020 [Arenicella chitinivorans]|uniref:Uncharacterized protein n=1 Tax=Arenicella chitinivorans TaxID=1329800 RepID=A0A918VSI5_9GAMM|nr:hypothetical protein [Arenicella chitinivorans]GHA20386.1 hypothetical protein GCM10008090_33020 [Arenicella chitinivorans]
MWGELHESKTINIELPEVISSGAANRMLKELGMTLHYDVYSFEAKEYENWQSQSLLYLQLRRNGLEVDAQDDFDEIEVSYLLATRPSSDQTLALKTIEKIIIKFNGVATYQGEKFEFKAVQNDWDSCNRYLLQEWGEEPGNKELRRMIEENYA